MIRPFAALTINGFREARRHRVSVVVCGFASGAPLLSAQSLGDVAKREAARRKTITSAGKVYTNDSLRPEPAPARGASAPPPAAPAAAQGQTGQTAAQADTIP